MKENNSLKQVDIITTTHGGIMTLVSTGGVTLNSCDGGYFNNRTLLLLIRRITYQITLIDGHGACCFHYWMIHLSTLLHHILVTTRLNCDSFDSIDSVDQYITHLNLLFSRWYDVCYTELMNVNPRILYTNHYQTMELYIGDIDRPEYID
jgi:hypothetical protein